MYMLIAHQQTTYSVRTDANGSRTAGFTDSSSVSETVLCSIARVSCCIDRWSGSHHIQLSQG